MLITLSIMAHVYLEILSGIYDKKETEIESIQQATTRYVSSLNLIV